MSLLDKIFNRDTPEPAVTASASDVLLKALLSGHPISKETALSIPAVASAVDRISNTVAMLPVRMYQATENAEGQRTITEVKKDPRTQLLNVEGGDTLDTFQTKKAVVRDYLLDHGAYQYIDRQPNGTIDSLRYIDPGFVSYVKNADPIFKVAKYLVNGRSLYPYQFVIMLRNTEDGVVGKSLTGEINKVLAAAVESIAFELGLVLKGGSKKGFLQSTKKLDQPAMDALRAAWKKLYSNDEENIVILNDGMEFKEASNSSVEMQLDERKKTLSQELRDIFHVSDDFDRTVKEAVMPVINAYEAALSRNLLTEDEKEQGYYFAFDTSEITKGDIKARYEAYKIAAAAGFMTKNEIRAKENLDPIEGLDVVSLGLGDVLYDVKTKQYYVPNTGSSKKMSDVLLDDPDKNKEGEEE